MARLTQITKELSPQLSNYPSLIKFAESVRDLLLDLKPGLTRESVTQLSQELEIDLAKFPELGIRKVRSLGINQILLVEDEQEVIEDIREVLSSQYGIAVRGTDDVNEVIELAESSQIDLILINYGLPNSRYKNRKVDGLKLVRILRDNPNISASLPIVGFSLDPVATKFRKSGADGFYSKQELFESRNYQKFVDYLQEIYNYVTQTKSSKPGKNYAIAIGINNYYFFSSLKYAVRDAEAMYDWFGTEGGFQQVYLFTDNSPPITDAVSPLPSQPTYANLRRFLQERFGQPFLSAGDDFWFFFSGHGLRHRDVDYIMLADSDNENIEKTAISVNYIKERLRRSGAGNILMFVDASRSFSK